MSGYISHTQDKTAATAVAKKLRDTGRFASVIEEPTGWYAVRIYTPATNGSAPIPRLVDLLATFEGELRLVD